MKITEKEYIDFLDSNGLIYRESNFTHQEHLVWAVSTNKNDRLIVHDCCGKAYKGLRVDKADMFNFSDFCPAYGNNVLTLSALNIKDIKVRRIIHKLDDSVVWEVRELSPDRYLVIDYYDRVFTGLVLREGEDVLLEHFAPVYHGRLLKSEPSLCIRKPRFTV